MAEQRGARPRAVPPHRRPRAPWVDVLLVSLRLGLTSFGGPVAHLGYQRRAFVERLGWLDEAAFAELVALCQALPGPASSQLSIAVGRLRGGWAGAFAAWVGFTLPSAALMTGLGLLVAGSPLPSSGPAAGAVAGLKAAAVAVVLQAVVAMARRLAPDLPRATLAVGAGLVALAVPWPATQPLLIVAGALAGRLLFGRPGGVGRAAAGRRATGLAPGRVGPAGDDVGTRPGDASPPAGDAGAVGRLTRGAAAAAGEASPPAGDAGATPRGDRATAIALTAPWAAVVAAALLLGPTVAGSGPAFLAALARAGALVFGGGHVVLPLLHEGVVVPGWVAPDAFLAGYAAAQAVPGPLFTLASYLGALSSAGPGGIAGAFLATVAIFLPGGLLVLAALPVLRALRARPGVAAALAGTNAVVVGILGAALVTPVGTGGLTSLPAAVIAALGAAGLLAGRVAPLVVVLASAGAMALLAAVRVVVP